MGGRTLGIALGRRSISDKILVDYFVTRERPLYYFSLKLCSLLCIGTVQANLDSIVLSVAIRNVWIWHECSRVTIES